MILISIFDLRSRDQLLSGLDLDLDLDLIITRAYTADLDLDLDLDLPGVPKKGT